MMHHNLFLFLFCLSIWSCKNRPNVVVNETAMADSSAFVFNQEGGTIANRFSTPEGFVRTSVQNNSFGAYLRNFKLLAINEKVHLYDGSLKGTQDVHASILDIDVGNRDLQQCADAIMRLRAEYLFAQEKYADIAFDFTNGWKFAYSSWREGSNLIVKGNKTSWQPTNNPKTTYQDFRKYLDNVFMYAGTLSLSKELKSKPIESISIGDILIQGGSPGHAVIVVDVSKNEASGDVAFMLAQSYMPAQQIHVLKNMNSKETSPWYLLSEIRNQIITPEWAFSKSDLKNFTLK